MSRICINQNTQIGRGVSPREFPLEPASQRGGGRMGRGSCEMLVQIRTQVLDAVGLARRVRAVELICLRCYKLSTD